MLKKEKPKYMLNLMLIKILCLNSCTTIDYNTCPEYPIAGEKVAQELSLIPTNELEHTWEWIGRINKLRQELNLCKNEKMPR